MRIRGSFRSLSGISSLGLATVLIACSGLIEPGGSGDGDDDTAEAGAGGQSSYTGGTGATAAGNKGGASSGGTAGAMNGGKPGITCPSQPPFDESDEQLVAACTRPIAVAVGNALRRALSYDGETWFGDVCDPNEYADQNEHSHRNVAVAAGIIVIVGDAGIFTSRDAGLTFERKDVGGLHSSAVVFYKRAFWVLGNGLHTSKDGIDWQSWDENTTLPGGLRARFGSTDAATDGQVAIFLDGRSSYRRFDGATWTEGRLPVESGSSITYGGGRFVTVGGLTTITAASEDGSTWSAGSEADLRFSDVIWDGTRFFATGSQYDAHMQTSSDGLTWKRPAADMAIGPIARMNNMYIGANAGTLYRSNDGISWGNRFRACGENGWGFASIGVGPVLRTPPSTK